MCELYRRDRANARRLGGGWAPLYCHAASGWLGALANDDDGVRIRRLARNQRVAGTLAEFTEIVGRGAVGDVQFNDGASGFAAATYRIW